MKKELIRLLFSLVIVMFLIYVGMSIDVFGLELTQDYSADMGSYAGERYYSDMIAHSSIYCNQHGGTMFFKKQTYIKLSGTVNGSGFTKNVTSGGTYTIWSVGHGSCSGSSYSLRLEAVRFSGKSTNGIRAATQPWVATGAGATVRATGKTNYWLTATDNPKNNYLAYIIAEANANTPGLTPGASQANIAWWNRSQAANYSASTSYSPTLGPQGTDFESITLTPDSISDEIDDIKDQLAEQVQYFDDEIKDANDKLKEYKDLLQELKDTKDGTNSAIKKLEDENTTLTSEINTLNSEISTLDSEITSLANSITNCDTALVKLNQEKAALEIEKNNATTDAEKQAVQVKIDAKQVEITNKTNERTGYVNSKSAKETTRNQKQDLRNQKQAKYNANIIEINDYKQSLKDIKPEVDETVIDISTLDSLEIDDLIKSVEDNIKELEEYIAELQDLRSDANDAKNNSGGSSLSTLEKLKDALSQTSNAVIADQEGYSSSSADGILKEAAIFNAMHKIMNGNYKGTIKDNTVQANVKVEYDATSQKYIVGPFNITYLETYAFENQFSGITGVPKLKLNIDGTDKDFDLGDGWAFMWQDAHTPNKPRATTGTIGDQIPEKFNVYPHTDEDFYLVIDYKDGLNRIKGFHLDFRYLTAEGQYELYEGNVEKFAWTVSAPSFTVCNKYLGICHHYNSDDEHSGCHAKYCKKNKRATVSVTKRLEGYIDVQAAMRVVRAKRGYEPDEMDFAWNIDITTTLAGDVWLDKDPQKTSSSGHKGNWEGDEKGLDNIAVTVYLYQGTTKIRPALFHEGEGKQKSWPIYTSGGHYEIERLEAPGGASNCYYVVEFEYDGQVLKNTVYLSNGGSEGSASSYMSSPDSYRTSSMAVEEVIDRATLDRSFGEVTGESSISGNHTTGVTHTTSLDGTGAGGSGSLSYNGSSNGQMIDSKLESPYRSNSCSRGTRYNMVASTYYNDTDTLGVGVNKSQFRIQYPVEGFFYILNNTVSGNRRYVGEYMLHINLGLIERTETDISLLKDLYKVTVIVNEQKMTKEFNPYGTTTNYDDFLINLEKTRADGGYTLGLYSSDVGYQSYQRYNNAINAVKEIKDGTELKVYATYIIRVYNNSETNDVEINEITDYFDSTFTLVDGDRYTSIVNDDMKRHNTLVAEAPYYRICNVNQSNPWKPTREENKQGFGYTINGQNATGSLVWTDINSSNNDLYSSKTSTLTNIKLDNTEYAEIFTTYEIDRAGYYAMTGSGNSGTASITTRNALLGDKFNIAEVSNYSTYYSEKDIASGKYDAYVEGRISGRVDRDSAPNNIDLNDLKDMTRYEDDTFKANTLKISILAQEREMYGYVWEDEKTENVGSYELKVGNGYFDSGENLIPEVEVSLYEVINLGDLNSDGNYDGTYDGLEYYYKVPNQFYNLPKGGTSTGINGNTDITKTLAGKARDADGNEVDGNYYIYGFLAGDYVTRFDYGKNTDDRATIYTDTGVSSEEDIIKYNGQDYENTRFLAELTAGDALNDKYLDLTKDTKITVTDASGVGANTDINDLKISKARDNESRRIVVDSYSRNIENDRAEILRDRLANNTEYVEATQMFAETPIMSIEVADPQTMIKSQTPNTAVRANGSSSYNEKTDPNANQIVTYRYTIKNINLGLEKRAETDIRIEKFVDTVLLVKSNEIIFAAHMSEDGEVITDHTDSQALDKLTYISHSKAGLTQQGFYAIAIENEYMNDIGLLIKYKMKVINSSEVDFTGRLNDYYLAANMVKAANGSPTVDLYKMTLDAARNIELEGLDNQGISTNSTLAEILRWNISNPQLANLLTSSDLSPSGNIHQTDTLRPEVIVYGRYVGRFYYENRIGATQRTYAIKNYVKDTSVADINVTYAEDKVVRTTVDQLVDYIDVNTSLDTEESGIGIENTSWSLADVAVETDGTITSLRNIISDSAYRLNASGSDRSIYDEKDRKLIRDSSSNIAISHNERVERGSDNRMKYIDNVANRVQSIYNPSMTIELKPENYNSAESTGIIYIVTRKNTSSDQDANEMKMDNLVEVLVYSNPTGRRDVNSVPGNAMVIAKNNGFWKAGYNSIETYPSGDRSNWTVCPENDAWSPEYVTIIAPTGIGLMNLIRTNITQIAGLVMVIVAFSVMFAIKQVKIVNNRDEF